jgi:hypothetical protein
MVGKPKARGHRAYTQGVCSHICGAYTSLQPIMIKDTHTSYLKHELPASDQYPSTIRRLWPASNATPVGDVEGIMQENPKLGRQVKDMHVVILTGNNAHHYNKAQVTIRATRRS